MRFLLVFENSGDTIPVESINQELLEYYVDHMDQLGLNKFLADPSTGHRILEHVNSLDQHIVEINNIPIRDVIGYDIATDSIENYLDQGILNQLHADWANSLVKNYNISENLRLHNSQLTKKIHDMYPDNIPNPVIGDVLQKLHIDDIYIKINDRVHVIEEQFDNMQFYCNGYKSLFIDNPFPKKHVTNDICNFRLGKWILGRDLRSKYLNFDMKLVANDENTFNHFYGIVVINLRPPETIPYSKEYTQWCRSHNREPAGDYLNFGNIVDLVDKLTMYRQIIFRNLLNKNSFSIHLKRG
jgi:hypothetical protein